MTAQRIVNNAWGRLALCKHFSSAEIRLETTEFQAQKRRPWTSLDVEMVGRGNLNWFRIFMKNKDKCRLNFIVEYFLEYRGTEFELRMTRGSVTLLPASPRSVLSASAHLVSRPMLVGMD